MGRKPIGEKITRLFTHSHHWAVYSKNEGHNFLRFFFSVIRLDTTGDRKKPTGHQTPGLSLDSQCKIVNCSSIRLLERSPRAICAFLNIDVTIIVLKPIAKIPRSTEQGSFFLSTIGDNFQPFQAQQLKGNDTTITLKGNLCCIKGT